MSDLIDRQKAIDGLEGYIDDKGIFNQDRWFVHGIKTAITHVTRLPSAQPESVTDCHDLTDDLLSRKAVIDALRTCYDTEDITYNNGNEYISYDQALDLIESLPSAQPEQHTMEEYMYGQDMGNPEDGSL